MSEGTFDFDPDAPAEGEGIYGLPHSPEEAGTVVIPVPWEATVSYGAGTASGPEAVLRASRQVDLFDPETGRPYEAGIALLPIPREVREWSEIGRTHARSGRAEEVNRLSAALNHHVYLTAGTWLDRGKLVAVLGGEHSSPYGLIHALAEREPAFGILHCDAHADLRQAYEGFTYSHASIFRNVVQDFPGVTRIVQVGVRDLAAREDAFIRGSSGRILCSFDADLKRRQHEGCSWSRIASEVVETLPPKVYVSFDIDCLEPHLCPHTGTPVPGGLSFPEAMTLLRLLVESGRRIIGFDLCEVAPDPEGKSDWDENVGARLLYKMIGFARMSRN